MAVEDLASIGFEVDSSGLTKGAKGFNEFSSAAEKAESSAASFGREEENLAEKNTKVSQTARDVAQALIAQKSATDAYAQSFQSLVNQNLGVTDSSTSASRAADVEEYGRALDDLRAKFNPAFAAQQKYERNVEELQHAHRIGAINAEEYSSALAHIKASHAAQIGAINSAVKSTGKLSSGSARLASQMQNASYQVGDFAVQIASGGSAVTALAQQLPQLLGGFGLIGAAAGAGVAIAGAMWNAFASSGDAEDALERYNKLLDELDKRYDSIAATIAQIENKNAFSQSVEDEDDLRVAIDQTKTALDEAVSGLDEYVTAATRLTRANRSTGMSEFRDEARDLAAQLASGDITLSDFRTRLTEIAQATTDQKIADLAREMRDSTDDAAGLETQLNILQKALKRVKEEAESLNLPIDEMLAFMQLEGQYAAAAAGRSAPYEEMASALEKLADKRKKDAAAAAKQAARAAKQQTDFERQLSR